MNYRGIKSSRNILKITSNHHIFNRITDNEMKEFVFAYTTVRNNKRDAVGCNSRSKKYFVQPNFIKFCNLMLNTNSVFIYFILTNIHFFVENK